MLDLVPIDTVIVNGRLFTMDAPGHMVEALAIAGGRIIAMGSTAEILALSNGRSPAPRIIDAGGRVGLPGLIDSHCHPDMTGVRIGRWHDFSDGATSSRDAVLDLIRRELEGKPAGHWFLGYRYDDTREGGYPSREELDAASGGRPVFLYRRCSQMGVANSAALAEVGFAAESPDPPFGGIGRIAGSRVPSGMLFARAAHILIEHVQASYTPDDFRQGLIRVFGEYLSFGLSSIHNSLVQTQAIRACQDMRDRGELNLRVGLMITGRDEELMAAVLRSGLRTGFGDEWLRLVGVEWVGDGSTSGRTAAYTTPYVGTPLAGEPAEYRGTLLLDPMVHRRRVKDALDHGMIVCTDAMGDAAIAQIIEIYENVLKDGAYPDHRLRIEHCCAVTPPNLAGLLRNGIICSSAAGFAWDLGDAHIANRGAAAMVDFWPHRAMIDAGVVAPAHSDAPVCTANPFCAMSSLVNRRTRSGRSLGPSQGISVYEAVQAYTVHAAYAGREENLKGRLRPGMLGDVVLLDRDPFAEPKEALHETRVDATIVGGAVKFDRLGAWT
ncbi:amidohydrolase [Paenirhodobacter populi]|uniref:Amidohydrolase n=1 Tax=Paenirhodobacter populi TaxID=2306993 RepID=A0A443JC71_9RHOB|nr:amidohydrolase [Sinirhodobacter populi]RWR18111.1 amidohydrolase [Sinirhodobacter populi]